MPNSINIEGRLGKDAELRYSQNATPILSFSVACNTGFGDKQVTTWWNCTLFGKRAETLQAYMAKGQHVCVIGQASEEEWTDRDGGRRKSLKVAVNDVWLLGKSEGKKEGDVPKGHVGNAQQGPVSFDDDNIPF